MNKELFEFEEITEEELLEDYSNNEREIGTGTTNNNVLC